MISRKLSNDSTRTFCPISEQKLLEMINDNHAVLKYIHSKILQHVRMEKLLEPTEVLMYIQHVKNLHTDQPNIESFRKKIRTMLLTINDSLVQFEQAVCSGEVALYSIDIGQKCDFSQQSSGTSVAEVPSFSSIELTNRDFMTIPNNSQNSIKLDYCNTNFKKTKANSVNVLGEKIFKQYVRTKVLKKPLNKISFKKPMTRNKIKIPRSKIDKDLLNNKENLPFSIHDNKNATNSIRNDANNLKGYTSDTNQDIILSDLERSDSSKDINVYEICNINCENKLSQVFCSNNSKYDRKIKNNIDNELNSQDLHSQSELNEDQNFVRKKNCDVEHLNNTVEPSSCSEKEDGMMTSKENRACDINDIFDNVVPETDTNFTNTKNVQFLHNQSGKEKIIAHSFCSANLDPTFSVTKNYISQKPDDSCSQKVLENYTYLLEYHKYNNILESFILYKNLLPVLDVRKNASESMHHLKCNEHVDEELIAASNNVVAIGGELVSQTQNSNSYSQPYIKKLMNKNSNCGIQYGYRNIEKLHGKMALEAEHCFNTWDKLIQALAEVEHNISSEKFRKERTFSPNGYESQYDSMQKICDEYINTFNYHQNTNKVDDEYISIEKKIRKWSEFQELIIKMKEARKRKHVDTKL